MFGENRLEEIQTKSEKMIEGLEECVGNMERQIAENLPPEDIKRVEGAVEQFGQLKPEEVEELYRVYSLLHADNIG